MVEWVRVGVVSVCVCAGVCVWGKKLPVARGGWWISMHMCMHTYMHAPHVSTVIPASRLLEDGGGEGEEEEGESQVYLCYFVNSTPTKK